MPAALLKHIRKLMNVACFAGQPVEPQHEQAIGLPFVELPKYPAKALAQRPLAGA
jgi:hypothetical protein